MTPSGPSTSGRDAAWQQTVLSTWRRGQAQSMVGPGPIERHLDHAQRLAVAVAPSAFGARTPAAGTLVVDLGSGAGIPGLALAGWWPAASMLLVDAARRRVRLLQAAVEELGWDDRVTVLHARAEELARDARWREAADLVTARSFGPPAVTAECGVAFLRPGGLLVVTEPPAEEPAAGDSVPGDQSRWPAAPLEELGLAPEVGATTDAVPVQRLRRVGPLPASVPRRAGIPARRPRF